MRTTKNVDFAAGPSSCFDKVNLKGINVKTTLSSQTLVLVSSCLHEFPTASCGKPSDDG